MITPPVNRPDEARADYEELVVVEHKHAVLDGAPCHLEVLRTKDESESVAVFLVPGQLEVSDAEGVADLLEAPVDMHLIVGAMSYEDGFAEALDEATKKLLRITLIKRKATDFELLKRVAELSMPEPSLPPVDVMVTLAEHDFDRLTNQSVRVNEELLDHLAGVGQDKHVHDNWKWAYFMGDSYSNVLFATSFLERSVVQHQVVRDLRDDEWIILSDFESVAVRFKLAATKVRDDYEREKAEESGDELMKMFVAPAACKEEQGK